MFKTFKNIGVMLGIVLIATGCSNQIQVGEKDIELTNSEKPQTIPEAQEDIELTNAEKLQMILDVQKDEDPDKEKTINLYGFKVPCYLINIPEGELVEYKDTPYPHTRWNDDRNILMMLINDKYPENGGDTYRLENFLYLKFDEKKVEILMEKFKSGETQVIDIKDGTYILISTATDDTRVVTIGNMEELQELVGIENEMPPIYVIE